MEIKKGKTWEELKVTRVELDAKSAQCSAFVRKWEALAPAGVTVTHLPTVRLQDS